MNETNFEIVLDVLVREINMLRYRAKTAEDDNIKLLNRVGVLKDENEKLRNRVKALEEGNAKQHEILGEVLAKHE